jgi:hypothetical protein
MHDWAVFVTGWQPSCTWVTGMHGWSVFVTGWQLTTAVADCRVLPKQVLVRRTSA